MKKYLLALFLGLIITTANAANFDYQDYKGLSVYTLQDQATKIILTCDPDQLFAAPQEGIKPKYFLTIQNANWNFTSNTKVIISKTGFTESYNIIGDTFFPDEPKKWNKLIKALQEGGSFKLSAGNKVLNLQVNSSNLNCNFEER